MFHSAVIIARQNIFHTFVDLDYIESTKRYTRPVTMGPSDSLRLCNFATSSKLSRSYVIWI